MIKVQHTRFKAGEGFKIQRFGIYAFVDAKDMYQTRNNLGPDETLFVCAVDTVVFGDPTITPVTIFEIVGQGFVEITFKDGEIDTLRPVYKIGYMYHPIKE